MVVSLSRISGYMRDGLRWGGRFIPGDVVGVHTLSLLTSSWVAHDRTTEHNHTHRQGLLYTLSNTLAYSGSESGCNLDRGVLNPSPREYQIYTDINSLAYETVREVQPNTPLASKDLCISLGSKNPNISLNACKILYREGLL